MKHLLYILALLPGLLFAGDYVPMMVDTSTGAMTPPKWSEAWAEQTNGGPGSSTYLLTVQGDSLTNGPVAWSNAWGSNLVVTPVGYTGTLSEWSWAEALVTSSTGFSWRVWQSAGLASNVPATFLLLPREQADYLTWTATGPNTNYWTDPWYADYARLYIDAYTNASGVFLDSSPYAHEGSNMPSVLAGPVKEQGYANDYGRYQPYLSTTARAGQYVKFNTATSLVPTNAAGQIPFTWVAWISNSVPFTNANMQQLGMDKGASPSRCWRLVIQSGTPRFQVGSSNFGGYIECAGASWTGLSNQWFAVAGTHNATTGTTAGICLYVCTNFPTVVSNSARGGSGAFLGMNALPMPSLGIAATDAGANSRGDAYATFSYYIGTNLTQSELATVITNTYPLNNMVQKSWIPEGQ